MSEKFIDREYLLDSFKDYNTDIVEKKFDQINESLADYGLDNKAVNLLQGYYDVRDGSKYNSSKYLCTEKLAVSQGQTIKVIAEKTLYGIHFVLFNEDTYVSSITTVKSGDVLTVPSGVTKVGINFSYNADVSPNTSGHIGVYIDNAIDELNSNLSDLAYGDNGGYNIFKDTTWFVGRQITENGISDYAETGSAYSDYISIVEPNTYYISSFTHPKSTVFEYDANKSFIKYNGWKKDNNTPCVLSGNCAYIRISFNGASSNIQPSNVMLAKTPNLPYVPYIPSVKMLAEEVNTQNESLSALGKCKNLLNPTLGTTTQNGVTCTNNGDGTYTFNGTATANAVFTLQWNIALDVGTYAINSINNIWFSIEEMYSPYKTYGATFTKTKFTMSSKVQNLKACITIYSGVTISNVVFKPMLTTNLDTTYDDFVPYTGDGETLTEDVASLKNDLGGLSFSVSGTTLSITDGTNTWTLSN